MYGLPMWLWWVGAGVAAVLGGWVCYWSLFRDRARGRLRCPKCWYDMAGISRGSDGWRCPECGRAIRREKQLKRTRRRWRWALVGVVIAGVGVGLPVRRQVREEGWLSMAPTRVLVWAACSEGFSSDAVFRELVNQRIAGMGEGRRRSMVAALLGRLGTSSEQGWVIRLLGTAGGRDPRITPALLRALPRLSAGDRVWAIRNFRNYQADPAQVVEPLILILGDEKEDPEVRGEAADVLAMYRELAGGAQQMILRAMGDQNSRVRYAAAWCSGAISGDAAVIVPRLREMLTNPPEASSGDARLEWAAVVSSLGRYPEGAAVALSVFESQLKVVSDASMRRELLAAIARWGKEAAEMEPTLKAIATDPNEGEEGVLLAEAAIEIIHGRQPDLATAMAAKMRNPMTPNPRTASRLLKWMYGDVGPAVPLILEELENGTDYMLMLDSCIALMTQPRLGDDVLARLRAVRERWPESMVDYVVEAIERREWKGK